MTQTRAPIFVTPEAAERYKLEQATRGYTDYFSRALIETARAGNHDLASRSSFLITVGATAIVMIREYDISLSDHAVNAITEHSGLMVVGAVYSEFGDWNLRQWNEAVNLAAESVILSDGQEEIARTRTLANYAALLTALHDGHASFAAND